MSALAAALAAACTVPTGDSPSSPTLARSQEGSTGPTVAAFDPKMGAQGTTLDLFVTGTGYDQSSGVNLLLKGKTTPKVRTNFTTYLSPTDLVANVTIAGDATIADYDVQVANAGGKKGIGIEKFAVVCSLPVQLVATLAEDQSGTQAIRGDGSRVYAHDVDGLVVHTSGANGNLMASMQASTRRFAWSATRPDGSVVGGLADDRFYSNTHDNPGGDDDCGLAGLAPGSTGSAVLQAELVGTANNLDELRYGKDCDGRLIEATRVTTTRSADAATWTISGTSGVYCTRLAGQRRQQSGTAGPFSMTLTRK
jgi:hypothetical protein